MAVNAIFNAVRRPVGQSLITTPKVTLSNPFGATG